MVMSDFRASPTNDRIIARDVHTDAGMVTGTCVTTAAPPQSEVVGDWTIDTGFTVVQFFIKHLGFTTVRGRFIDIRGAIHCGDNTDPASASVEVTIAAASIATGNIEQDAYLRSAGFLDVARYPMISFTSTRVERMAKGRLWVTGDLTIRDVTRQIVLETTCTGRGTNPWGQEVVGFTARTQLRMNRKEYGLTWNATREGAGLFLGDTLDVHIELRAVKQTTSAGCRRVRHLTLLELGAAPSTLEFERSSPNESSPAVAASAISLRVAGIDVGFAAAES
jgi:polyisoprenoid-binding protein YceI